MENWFTVGKIDEKTYVISEEKHWEKFHSYLLIGDKKAALIDTGLGIGNIKEVVEGLTSLPIIVLTTHAHWDHIGGHHYFNEIYAHHLDARWLEEGLPLPIDTIKNEVIKDTKVEDLPKDFNIEDYQIFCGEVHHRLKNEEVIDLGNRSIQALHTPGHSPGHVCYYEEERGNLFSGDLLYKGTLYAFYPSTDPKLFFDSVHKVSHLKKISRILPSHHDLDIEISFVKEVYEGFKEIQSSGALTHGRGHFDFGSFKIII